MNFFKLISKNNEGIWAAIISAAVIAGLLQGMIIVNLNGAASSIAEGELNTRYFLLFLMSVLGYGLASNYASTQTVIVSSNLIIDLYIRIADKVHKADLRSFEEIGKTEIYNRLSTNSDIIMEAAKSYPHVGAAIVMIIFSAIYISIISATAIILITLFYIFGGFIYFFILQNIRKKINQSTLSESKFKGIFKHIIEGFKEIKINRNKSHDLLDNYIKKQSEIAKKDKISMEKNLVHASIFVQSFYYMIIAFTIFLLPQISSLQPVQIVMIAAVVLFSYGSMTRIVMSIPLIMKTENAINSIEKLESQLDAANDTKAFIDAGPLKRKTDLIEIELDKVMFKYVTNQGNVAFTLGPITMTAKTGEIIFVVGENGSGKSTLLKLIAGLYYAVDGQILVNNQVIGSENYIHYRDKISIIFTDFYLFDRFYGNDNIDENLLYDLLVKMELDGKIDFVDQKFTTLNLSAGEKKRLALLVSKIEDKQILIFDEIAADLDPEFRKFFYEIYLPELSAQGKLIIASCHDEKYFHLADKVVNLQSGKIIEGNYLPKDSREV